MRSLSTKPVLAVVFAASLALALSSCGRKGPLEEPAQAPQPPAQTLIG